ncbi:hypothetical protein HYT25_03385 [Candidatus Pacearchaeota archaeon]|nr:hypothetical protein [Candidatus Pacearchaeota archaeon]
MIEITSDELLFYRAENIQIRLSNKNGDVVVGYVHNFEISSSPYSHVELSDSPDKSQNASLVYLSAISRIEPADLEKSRISLLERYSSDETEIILKKMRKSL